MVKWFNWKGHTVCIILTVEPLQLSEVECWIRNLWSSTCSGCTILKIHMNKLTDCIISDSISCIALPFYDSSRDRTRDLSTIFSKLVMQFLPCSYLFRWCWYTASHDSLPKIKRITPSSIHLIKYLKKMVYSIINSGYILQWYCKSLHTSCSESTKEIETDRFKQNFGGIPKLKRWKIWEIWSFNLESGEIGDEREKEEPSFLGYAISKEKNQIQKNKQIEKEIWEKRFEGPLEWIGGHNVSWVRTT